MGTRGSVEAMAGIGGQVVGGLDQRNSGGDGTQRCVGRGVCDRKRSYNCPTACHPQLPVPSAPGAPISEHRISTRSAVNCGTQGHSCYGSSAPLGAARWKPNCLEASRSYKEESSSPTCALPTPCDFLTSLSESGCYAWLVLVSF